MEASEKVSRIESLASVSYKKYSVDKCIDTYEGYQFIDGYKRGYEQGAEDIQVLYANIKKLESQLIQLRCCQNCKWCDTDCEGHFVCTAHVFFDCRSNTIFDNRNSHIDEWEAGF